MGLFSYIAAAGQEKFSGLLIYRSSEVVDGVMQYDFSGPIVFWISASVVSGILSVMTWKTKVCE